MFDGIWRCKSYRREPERVQECVHKGTVCDNKSVDAEVPCDKLEWDSKRFLGEAASLFDLRARQNSNGLSLRHTASEFGDAVELADVARVQTQRLQPK